MYEYFSKLLGHVHHVAYRRSSIWCCTCRAKLTPSAVGQSTQALLGTSSSTCPRRNRCHSLVKLAKQMWMGASSLHLCFSTPKYNCNAGTTRTLDDKPKFLLRDPQSNEAYDTAEASIEKSQAIRVYYTSCVSRSDIVSNNHDVKNKKNNSRSICAIAGRPKGKKMSTDKSHGCKSRHMSTCLHSCCENTRAWA